MDAGSSPLARGLHEGGVRPRRRHRIIPARAGFTSGGGPRRQPPPDHPRSRGVYSSQRRTLFPWVGSSPLARGLPSAIGNLMGGNRIIPARAGFTQWSHPPPEQSQDHPRSRGVYKFSFGISTNRPWIIPARAGFTRPDRPLCRRPPDHPRSRGVYRAVTMLRCP